MSAVKDRAATARQKKAAPGVVTGLPQVNLLPPEVRAARSLSVVKRWLVLTVVLVLAVVVLVYAFAALVRGQAADRLADAEARTAELRIEERKYVEVPQVLGAIQRTTEARLAGTATEILWRPYLDAVTAVMPAGVSIDSFSLTGPSPTALTAPAASPLDAPAVASMTFEARSLTIPDTSAILEALATVPGLQDPWASGISVAQSDAGVYYTVSLSVQLAETTLAERFVATEEN